MDFGDALLALTEATSDAMASLALSFTGSLLGLSRFADPEIASVLDEFSHCLTPFPDLGALGDPTLDDIVFRTGAILEAAEEEPQSLNFFPFGVLVIMEHALRVQYSDQADTELSGCLGHGADILDFLDEKFPGHETFGAMERCLDSAVTAIRNSSTDEELPNVLWNSFSALRVAIGRVG